MVSSRNNFLVILFSFASKFHWNNRGLLICKALLHSFLWLDSSMLSSGGFLDRSFKFLQKAKRKKTITELFFPRKVTDFHLNVLDQS